MDVQLGQHDHAWSARVYTAAFLKQVPRSLIRIEYDDGLSHHSHIIDVTLYWKNLTNVCRGVRLSIRDRQRTVLLAPSRKDTFKPV